MVIIIFIGLLTTINLFSFGADNFVLTKFSFFDYFEVEKSGSFSVYGA